MLFCLCITTNLVDINELQSRFEQPSVGPVLAIERLLMKAANQESTEFEIGLLKESIYKEDFDFTVFERQVPVITDVIHQVFPTVKKVTRIRTVCDALTEHSYRQMLSEVHKLLRLYLTLPVTSSTSERAFFTLRRLLNYLRSTMTEKRLNNCLLLHQGWPRVYSRGPLFMAAKVARAMNLQNIFLAHAHRRLS